MARVLEGPKIRTEAPRFPILLPPTARYPNTHVEAPTINGHCPSCSRGSPRSLTAGMCSALFGGPTSDPLPHAIVCLWLLIIQRRQVIAGQVNYLPDSRVAAIDGALSRALEREAQFA